MLTHVRVALPPCGWYADAGGVKVEPFVFVAVVIEVLLADPVDDVDRVDSLAYTQMSVRSSALRSKCGSLLSGLPLATVASTCRLLALNEASNTCKQWPTTVSIKYRLNVYIQICLDQP